MRSLRRNNTHRSLGLILVIAPLVFVCIAVVAAMQGIHLTPAAPTFRQDQAELARLESKSAAPGSAAHLADPRIAEARTDLERPMIPSIEDSATAVELPDKPPQSKAIASRGHGARNSHSKTYQAELARQRAVAASQYRYAQQESGSFFSSIAHALGFSGR